MKKIRSWVCLTVAATLAIVVGEHRTGEVAVLNGDSPASAR